MNEKWCNNRKEIQLKYDKSEKGKNRFEKYKNDNHEKQLAMYSVSNAIRNGKLNKPDNCSICNETFELKFIHAHHENYLKKLDVIWCCPQCHKNLHKEAS